MIRISKHPFFYYFLGILFLHGLLLFHQIKNKIDFKTSSLPLRVKILSELANSQIQKAKKQIVQSEDSAKQEQKKDAYLSDKDRAFDRQSVAKNIDTFHKMALGNNSKQNDSFSKPSNKSKQKIKDVKLSDLGMTDYEVPKPSRSPASAGMKGQENGDPASQGFSSTNDYVEEVALGDFTHLNTVEYKFYGFYHRIRQKLEQFWGKSIQEKAEAIFRSGRRLPAGQDLVTSLQITLNSQGEIIGVKVLGASGVRELDDAAVESFNQAGPFPNPPKELVINGKATIQWGFVVKS